MSREALDHLISELNRKISVLDIDRKDKLELLGLIVAIGYAAQEKAHVPDNNVGNMENGA